MPALLPALVQPPATAGGSDRIAELTVPGAYRSGSMDEAVVRFTASKLVDQDLEKKLLGTVTYLVRLLNTRN